MFTYLDENEFGKSARKQKALSVSNKRNPVTKRFVINHFSQVSFYSPLV